MDFLLAFFILEVVPLTIFFLILAVKEFFAVPRNTRNKQRIYAFLTMGVAPFVLPIVLTQLAQYSLFRFLTSPIRMSTHRNFLSDIMIIVLGLLMNVLSVYVIKRFGNNKTLLLFVLVAVIGSIVSLYGGFVILLGLAWHFVGVADLSSIN